MMFEVLLTLLHFKMHIGNRWENFYDLSEIIVQSYEEDANMEGTLMESMEVCRIVYMNGPSFKMKKFINRYPRCRPVS